MLLSARWMNEVSGVNSFRYTTAVETMEGDPRTLYFQLVDESVEDKNGSFGPIGRRYMPAAGATVEVTFVSVDGAKNVARFASQPYAQDPSIWSVAIAANDTFRGTVSIKIKLTEGATVRNAYLDSALRIRSKG